jgi:carbonic anhydrase
MKPESPASALAALIEGNRRFAAGEPELARRDPARRSEVASGQHPRAAVVTCSDSRVGPEIVFDQGLGDIFVVRTGSRASSTQRRTSACLSSSSWAIRAAARSRPR